MTIDIYRGNSITAVAEIDSSTVFSAQVNGEDKITATFRSDVPLNLMIKDYIIHKGLKYQILKFVDLDIAHDYTYGAVLMGTSYSLFAKPFLNDGGLSTFTISGTATQLLTILVGRINSIDSGWTVGEVEDDGRVLEVGFVGDTCRSALGRIFNAFGLEVSYVVKEISLTKRFELVNDAIPLAYGINNGLYSLSKRVEGEFFTRVRGFGSTKNIPAGYRGGMERLSFSPGYVDIADAASYGEPIEIEVVFEDVYPHRTGSLSSASAPTSDGQVIADTSIDFNLADNFITGETPKIVMASGHWTGSEFEIDTSSYNNTTKSFKIRPNTEGGFSYPSVVLPLQAGDTYVFIGINLPQSYVDVAELGVKNLTTEYANRENKLDVSYGLVIDPIHVIEEGLVPVLNVGQKIQVTNVPTGINANMRITSITYPLIEPWKVTATISDKVQYSEEQQIQRIVIESAKQVQVVKENIVEVKAFTSRRLDENQAMVFDPFGNYYSEKIKPLSIETLQLTVGSRTQLFTLSSIMQPNFNNVQNVFHYTAGKLVHYTVVPGSTYTWNIPDGTISGLVTETAYYIYARCNKANNNATIVLDTVARQIESDSTYYYFLVGTLLSAESGVRPISLSYGITEVNGKFIKGTLTSQDGSSYIDLNTGEIVGTIYFKRPDGSYEDVNDVKAEALQAFDKATDAKTKTDLLKSLAYEDLVEAAMEGEGMIIGGFMDMRLINVDFIRADVMKAQYIEALDVNFVKGTIGGININNSSIASDNGNFSVDGAGQLIAKSGSFGNILIEADRIRSSNNKFILTDAGALTAVDATVTGTIQTAVSGQRAVLDASSNSFKFYDGSGVAVEITTGLSNPFGGGGAGVSVGGSSGSSLMLPGAIAVVNGGNRIAIAGDAILIVKGSSYYTGSTTTKTIGGTALQFVDGLLVN